MMFVCERKKRKLSRILATLLPCDFIISMEPETLMLGALYTEKFKCKFIGIIRVALTIFFLSKDIA